MAGPKKHHFLPQFYLRRFADPREKLWLYRKSAESKGIPTHVLKAGMENHFHTLDWSRWGARSDDPESIERALSKMESAQARMLRQILDLDEPLSAHLESVAQFASTMWHRVPSFKRDVEENLSRLLAHSGRMLLKAGAFPPPPEELQSLIQERDGDIFEPEIANWKLLEFMFLQLRDTPIPGILSRMNYRLVRPGPQGGSFVTGDTPVVLYDEHWDNDSPQGVGFATPTVEISLPLSAFALIVFRHDDRLPPPLLSAVQVRHYNQRTIVAAWQSIYAPEQNDAVEADVRLLHQQSSGPENCSLPAEGGHVFVSRHRPVTPCQLSVLL
jgi:hypothetical protein